MPQPAPGRSYRRGLTVVRLMNMFPDEDVAHKWFESVRWQTEMPYARGARVPIHTEERTRRCLIAVVLATAYSV